MVKAISGLRVGNSFLTPSGAQVVTQEIDFQLATREAIELFMVSPYISQLTDASVAAADDVAAQITGFQSLHLETGVTEDPPNGTGEDVSDRDTEVIYRQDTIGLFINPSTAGDGSGIGLMAIPPGPVTFPMPIISVRNLTHRAETLITGHDVTFGILIYYRYVELSDQELGIELARRI